MSNDDKPAKITALYRDPKQEGAPYMVTPEGVALIEKLASEGYSNARIASQLGIDRKTLTDIRKRQPEVQEAIDRGKAADEQVLTDELRRRALAPGGSDAALFFYLKCKHGWREGDARDGGGGTVNVQIIQLPAAMSREQYMASLPPPSEVPPGDEEPED